MVVLNGIKNFLTLIYDNWTLIVFVLGIGIAIFNKIKNYLEKSDDERIEIAKQQLEQTILKWISDAEVEYEEWNKAGSIKRSQVIQDIFGEYPILSKVIDQEGLIIWIDKLIDDTLIILREIKSQNQK